MPPPQTPAPAIDPKLAARAAHLRYVTDRRPGITRKRRGKTWHYFAPDGTRITDADEIARINKLAIPPAYTHVWICPAANGHLQAVGRDARGRKQYRYHPNWRAVRDEAKYGKMLVFGHLLPKIRHQVQQDLGLPGLPKRKVVAAVVALLEQTMMRVGNEEYAKTNKSFGLTTLRTRHATIRRGRVAFDFRGKHGIQHHIDLTDRRLARVVKRCRDLPGQDLFQYLAEDGSRDTVGSEDVNDYLRDITGEEITAKDFRTWAATTLAAITLRAFEAFDNEAKARKNLVAAVEQVAKTLGNTPAICRKCYIHPAVFDGYLDGTLLEGFQSRAEDVLDSDSTGLTAEEIAITAFLNHRLNEAVTSPGCKTLKT